jgi:aldose 1-epimerase
MKITTTRSGNLPPTMIWMTNDAGTSLTLTDLGATVVAIELPLRCDAARAAVTEARDAYDALGREVTLIDVALGHYSYDDYMTADTYLGATVGRYANRIARGDLTIGGASYELDRNQNGLHTLHGGGRGWHMRFWKYEIDKGAGSVKFSLHSPDGDQGFPGAADIEVTYTLTEDNTVRIAYHAVPDADTVFNLTNHTYFNLDGEGAGSVLDHVMRINASRYIPTDADSIPTGEIRAVGGTAFDFTRGKRIGRDIDSGDEQLELAGGYDHCFVIDGAYGGDGTLERELREAAVVKSGVTGIQMTVRTDLPGVQFYSGNYLGAGRPSKLGVAHGRREGFCLETQFFPDSPHHANFPSTVFRAGEIFNSVTEYSFRS